MQRELASRPVSRLLHNLAYDSLEVVTGLVANYDSSDENAIKNQAAGSLSSLLSTPKLSYTATQGTGSAQPTTGSSTQNGRKTISYDGGDYLICPSGLFSIPAGDHTIFTVSIQDTSGVADRIISGTVAGSTKHFVGYFTDGEIRYYNNQTFSSVVSSGVTTTNFNITAAFKSGTTQSISVNSATPVTSTAGLDVAGIDGFAVGSSATGADPLNGDIAQVLIFNRTLPTAEILRIERFLSKKWGIAI